MVDVNGAKHERRGSPLFFHIHQFPNGKAMAVQLLLPAQFLPDGEKITMSVTRGATAQVKTEADWKVIRSYMNRDAFAGFQRVLG